MSSRAAKWVAVNGGALNPLTLSGELVAGVPVVLSIVGATAGSTITAANLPAGWTLNSGARTLSGTPSVGLDVAFALIETLAGKANSPKSNPQRLLIVRAPVPYDPDAADAARFATPANRWAESVGINSERLTKLLRAFDDASNGYNPYDRDVMAAPPTVACTAATDATLGPVVALAAGGVLTAAAQQRIAWYGGKPIPTNTGTKYVAIVGSSRQPAASSNISGYAGTAGVTTSMDMWPSAIEIMTDMQVIEFAALGRSNRPMTFQIDGQYVSKAGTPGAQAGGADNFWKLTFATRKVRRIRVGLSPDAGTSGATMLYQIRGTATGSFWKPDQSNVLKMAWAADSYGEGQPNAFLAPNGPMAQVAGELLGIRDVHQVSVGQTGYVADASAARLKLIDQIPLWLNPAGAIYQGPFDLITIGMGYNDFSFAAQVQANALACYQLIRQLAPNTPIVALGSQCGRRGPDAGSLLVETNIRAAVTQFNDPLCKFAPVSSDPAPWLFGTGYNGATNGSGNSDFYVDADAIHPSNLANGGGHEALGYRAANAIRTAVKSMIAA